MATPATRNTMLDAFCPPLPPAAPRPPLHLLFRHVAAVPSHPPPAPHGNGAEVTPSVSRGTAAEGERKVMERSPRWATTMTAPSPMDPLLPSNDGGGPWPIGPSLGPRGYQGRIRALKQQTLNPGVSAKSGRKLMSAIINNIICGYIAFI
ncbi:hypothetical protein NDU88_000557 [Pleurodeles waltl]|uniref:Uncharacterized protein n=1 Tax=Pleurodeles waltl TaxID=8319 RepID=A0AAV7KVX5_PLEWA|nr:hypothetical protein NDU88_000557 [Pleurodeles waltl]